MLKEKGEREREKEGLGLWHAAKQPRAISAERDAAQTRSAERLTDWRRMTKVAKRKRMMRRARNAPLPLLFPPRCTRTIRHFDDNWDKWGTWQIEAHLEISRCTSYKRDANHDAYRYSLPLIVTQTRANEITGGGSGEI